MSAGIPSGDPHRTRNAPISSNVTNTGEVSKLKTVFNSKETSKVCTDPIVYGPNFDERLHVNVQAYYIVMNPPAAGCKYPVQYGNNACVPVDPYAWGKSLLPVFLANTNLVYVNPDCAKWHS